MGQDGGLWHAPGVRSTMQRKRSACNDLHRALPAETSLMTLHTRPGRRAITAGLLAVVLCLGAVAAARDDADSDATDHAGGRSFRRAAAGDSGTGRSVRARDDPSPQRARRVRGRGGRGSRPRARVVGRGDRLGSQLVSSERLSLRRVVVRRPAPLARPAARALPGRCGALRRSLIVTSSTTAHSATRWPGGTGRSGSG